MNTATIETLTEKLKGVPEHLIERIIGYVDGLIVPKIADKPFQLTKDQQKNLDEQLDNDKNTYIEAEELYYKLKKKYDL